MLWEIEDLTPILYCEPPFVACLTLLGNNTESRNIVTFAAQLPPVIN
jgi:hypothetical protein